LNDDNSCDRSTDPGPEVCGEGLRVIINPGSFNCLAPSVQVAAIEMKGDASPHRNLVRPERHAFKQDLEVFDQSIRVVRHLRRKRTIARIIVDLS